MIKKSNNLLIVLVLYNELLEDSKTFKSLILETKPLGAARYTLLIYDNSLKVRSDLSFLEQYRLYFEFFYISDKSNPGISYAYNTAIDLANKENVSWLLLLDQDTVLSPKYISTFLETVKTPNEFIVSYVPRIFSKLSKNIISPFRINSIGIMNNISNEIKGIFKHNAIAINSGAFVNVNFVNSIGGFSKEYPLDMLDFWLFDKIYSKGKYLYILDMDIEHDLSVLNFENDVSLSRYKSILSSENLFFKTNVIKMFIYKIRLIKRLLLQSQLNDKSYFKVTLKFLFK